MSYRVLVSPNGPRSLVYLEAFRLDPAAGGVERVEQAELGAAGQAWLPLQRVALVLNDQRLRGK